ncbi:MAG: WYL domain-containing protein [Microthrixaceae bacterium]|nr:WYL domain-containing protein [Microthrixaceae bacterium]
MSKLERLLNLTALLLNTERPLRIDRIGELMEGYPSDPQSFRRTFERDKDDLREMGIPVEVVSLDVHDQTVVGYRIDPERYYLPDPDLDADELAALKLALRAVRLDGIAASEALRKLGASDADEGPALASVPAPPVIGDVHQAINEHRLIEFDYNGERRTVEPRRLEFQRGRWYLTGHDRLRDDRRSFRLDRIVGGVSSGAPGSFEPRDASTSSGTRFDPWRHGDDPPVTAVVRIDASQAALSRGHVGETTTWTDEPDGSATIEMVVTNRRAFRTFALGFLEHAEVVSPPELRAELLEWLNGVVA